MKNKKLVIYSTAGLALYSVLGFFVVPPIAKHQIQKIVPEMLGVTPEIKRVSFNPFTFTATLEGFSLPKDPKDTLGSPQRLSFDRFLINLTLWPLLKKEIRISELELKTAKAQVILNKDGTLNWALNPSPSSPKPKENSSPWTLTLESVTIEQTSIDLWDYTHPTPMELPLGPVSLHATNISTSLIADTALKSLSISLGERGHLSLSGNFSLTPLSANIQIDIQRLPLDFLTAFLSDRTTLALKSGALDLQGTLHYANGNVDFKGQSGVRDFSLIDNDKVGVLDFSDLKLKDIEASTQPMKFTSSELAVSGLKTKVVLRKDGTLNFKTFLKPQKQVAKVAPATSAPVYSISKITFQKGELDYADEQIKPHFMAHIHDLQGSVAPLSNDLKKKILIGLKGLVEANGQFNASGYVIPKTRDLDLKTLFHNIEMTTFTPYSGNFAGYEISKGKLFIDFGYTLAKNRIKGDHSILLDQFELGNQVESDNATHFPVKLALALLKDQKGQIKFKLPVEGDVNDPSFSVSNLVWTAVKNMFMNIVTSPFSLISGLVGGGPDLQSIYFPALSEMPMPDEGSKIDKVIQALSDRPGLALEISGQYSDQDVRKMAEKELKEDVIKNATSPDDLEKKLFAAEPEAKDQLKALALSRGKAVMALFTTKQIDMTRVYLLSSSRTDHEKGAQTLLNLRER